VSREEIIAAMKECVEKLGRVPRLEEFRVTMEIKRHVIRKHFCSYMELLSACGLERLGPGIPISTESMFLDWAGVVRSRGRVPTSSEYDRFGTYSTRAYMARFRFWREVPAAMLAYAVERGKAEEWDDVVRAISEHMAMPLEEAKRYRLTPGSNLRPRQMADRPIYGQPMAGGPLTFAPTNEAGVLAAFVIFAPDLGFAIQRLQMEFPDCEAMREVGTNRWQRVRIEFEYESRNFVDHQHPASGCDLIVCWFNNWESCPLEVIALSEVLPKLKEIEKGKTHR